MSIKKTGTHDTSVASLDVKQAEMGALFQYEHALRRLTSEPQTLLSALIVRNQVDAELHHQAQAQATHHINSAAYSHQLQSLVTRIGTKHPSYTDALLYKHRLSENLQQSERYGDTETLRAERAKVVERLNDIALAALGIPFDDLLVSSNPPKPQADSFPSDRLIVLDQQLLKSVFQRASLLAYLADWRASLTPSENAWWWWLDKEFETREQERDLPWNLLSALFMTISLALSAEIIRRLWVGAPDGIAIFGTVLTLLVTGSPLLNRGPELTRWIFQRLHWLSPRFRGEAMAAMAAIALVLILIGWFSLPALGTYYNNRGNDALAAGQLTNAELFFTRAAALNSDIPVPYYNLADTYETSGSTEEALIWYLKSVQHDRLFRPAYHRLGFLYNQQREYRKAYSILIAGLDLTNPKEDDRLRNTTNYMLLANLGWTLFAQGEINRAKNILDEAIVLERSVDATDRLRLPHYYLAQVYCSLQQPNDALGEIQATLRFGDPQKRDYQLWSAAVNEFLARVKAGANVCEIIPAAH